MFTITHIDTATIILEIDGLRIITDPVFDPPGKLYHHGWGAFSKKTTKPSQSIKQIGAIDLALISHHQHKDNLDKSGRNFIEKVPHIISTTFAAKKLKNVTGLENWQSTTVKTKSGTDLKVTATPCQHGPKLYLPFTGKVIGFVLESEILNAPIYISGDTVLFKGVREVGDRFSIGTAILHIGAVKFKYLSAGWRYTFNAVEAIETARLLNAEKIIPIHYDGWSHFKEKPSRLKEVIKKSDMADKFHFLNKGEKYTF